MASPEFTETWFDFLRSSLLPWAPGALFLPWRDRPMVALLRLLGEIHVGIRFLNALPRRGGEARDMACTYVLSHP